MPYLDNPRIIAAIERLVRLRPGELDPFRLGGHVVPVLDLLPLIGSNRTTSTTVDVSGGNVIFATTPSDQVWKLLAVARGAMVSTTSNILIQAAASGAGAVIVGVGAAARYEIFGAGHWMFPGDFLSLQGGNVADVTIGVTTWYTLYTASV